MDEYRSEEEIELDARRPTWVAIAAILFAIGSALQIGGVISGQGVTTLSIITSIILSLNFIVAYGLFKLKKWAYWIFIGLNFLGIILFISKLGVISTNTNVFQFIPLLVSIAWVIYFFTKPVRNAFRINYEYVT